MTDNIIVNHAKKNTGAIHVLNDDIAKAEAKLKKLYEQKKAVEQREREKSQKLVMELIKTERLDLIAPDIWKKALPQIKDLLTAG